MVAPPEPQPPPEIGAPGPDFLLQTDAGEELSLADLSGRRVVLYFYPRDNTPGCTVEAGGFRDHHPDFEARNAVVLGVSRDSVKSHAGFKSKQNLPFTLLSDPTGQTIAAYGSWGQKKFMGRTFMGIQRTTVILDEDGIVRYIFPKVSPKEHAQEVLDALDELD
ncbi:MAG: thioredoxin-dependent thiol peroxidase [Myxococcota bacterium]